jgi:hypothetical protein
LLHLGSAGITSLPTVRSTEALISDLTVIPDRQTSRRGAIFGRSDTTT